ncbi:TIGR01244 family sulfur transferase [Falsirhodobacter halotolerans]|uniref:TIGR01244 family sulfur transferase n=1 Tax=Falsirhodobacter halotolerans TaxID=1146892 RepID=UPI001FCFD490|nr:protein tyrosine phosphatase family protein [Falsirhodobacter halotolerans]MCJ8139484.1 protein tyrosine phosphatase family protein [Falsirhodobacter halotolerans]
MDIRPITDTYAVSPQIRPEDVTAIRDAGYTTVIDNRPDGEITQDLQTDAMRQAVEDAGLTFVANPVIGGQMTMDNVEAQRKAMTEATGPVFAYCASGTRSSVVWALANARYLPVEELIALPARHGYQLDHLRPMLERLHDV